MDILYPFILPVPQEKRKLKGRERTAFLSRHARRAVCLSAEKSGSLLEAMQTREDGCPIPENGVHWSVTHKPSYVAGVAADLPIGIDVEPLRPVDPKLFNRIADENERRIRPEDRDLFFFRSWTAREAAVKAIGGKYPDIFHCGIVEIPDRRNLVIALRNHRFHIEHFFFDGHIAAVVTNGMAVEWCIGEIGADRI